MTRLKQLLIAALLSVAPAVSAAEYQWLTFRLDNGSELSVAAENLEISYADGRLYMKSATVDQTLVLTSVKSMRFTSEPSAVDAPEVANTAGDYFNAAGIKVGAFASADEARRSLPSGVYVVKSGIKTAKVIF